MKVLSSVEFSGRKPGTQGHQLAEIYLINHFKTAHPNATSGTHSFTYSKSLSEIEGHNYYFIKNGNSSSKKSIVISAHYDHLGKHRGRIYPGADDNASGTSVLLGLKLWLENHELNNSIILLATDAEEDGLHGAKAFLKDEVVPIDSIKLNINLDMIGYGVKQKYLILAGLKRSPQFANAIKKVNITSPIPLKPKETIVLKNRSMTKQRLRLHDSSDHYAFYKAGIPYLFITGENHRYYHKPTDTFERIDQDFYKSVYESIINLLQVIDKEI